MSEKQIRSLAAVAGMCDQNLLRKNYGEALAVAKTREALEAARRAYVIPVQSQMDEATLTEFAQMFDDAVIRLL